MWDLDSYVEALDRAGADACEIAGGPSLDVVGAGSGGETRAASFSLLVAILDIEGGRDTPMGLPSHIETLELARLFSRSKG